MTIETSVSTTHNRMVTTGGEEQKLKSGNEMKTYYDIAYPNPRSAVEGTVYDVAPRLEAEQGGYEINMHSVSQPQKVQVASTLEYDYVDVPHRVKMSAVLNLRVTAMQTHHLLTLKM